MVSSSQHRGRASIIFIFVLIVSLFLFALYLKANPDFLRTPSTHISSHVKIWADPYQSIALELRQVLLLSIVILFSALLITPKISTLVGGITENCSPEFVFWFTAVVSSSSGTLDLVYCLKRSALSVAP